jgi:putative transposase
MQYLRAKTSGATYFFTLVTDHRCPIFGKLENIDLLREAFRYVMRNYRSKIDAIVILPEHFHYLWTLLENNAGFSTFTNPVIMQFSNCACQNHELDILTAVNGQ